MAAVIERHGDAQREQTLTLRIIGAPIIIRRTRILSAVSILIAIAVAIGGHTQRLHLRKKSHR